MREAFQKSPVAGACFSLRKKQAKGKRHRKCRLQMDIFPVIFGSEVAVK
jgi:hypothetical protein